MNFKHIFTMMAATLMLTACGGNTTKNKTTNEAAEVAATILDIDALLADAATLAGQEVEFEGICTHICKHGGTKIFLMGSDDKHTLRVEAAALGSFKQQCVNSIVKVKGTLVEDRIDEAYLQRWEAAAAAAMAKQHGETEAGCDTEKAARGETGNTIAERIADFRAKIAAQKETTGKDYLSFYHVEARSYEILE